MAKSLIKGVGLYGGNAPTCFANGPKSLMVIDMGIKSIEGCDSMIFNGQGAAGKIRFELQIIPSSSSEVKVMLTESLCREVHTPQQGPCHSPAAICSSRRSHDGAERHNGGLNLFLSHLLALRRPKEWMV